MRIIAFGTSNSSNSINQEFATFTAKLFKTKDIEIINLNDYNAPMYSIDKEMSDGYPIEAIKFVEKLATADLIIISLAEYNGSYTPYFKNLFDWSSRYD